jgi:hypothetical protein
MSLNLDKRLNHPAFQAAFVLCLAVLLMGASRLFIESPAQSLFPWSVGAAFMLFFAILNSLLSIRAESFVKYWQASMYSYMGLALGTGLAAWLFTGVKISEAGSYQWIYLVVSIGFIVFLSMVNFMKIIVKYAEKEEWNQPRRRD